MSYEDARQPLAVLTCGSCKHWHPNPESVQRGPILLDQQPAAMGECRERIHMTQLPYQNGKICFVGYPPLPENYQACGQHHPRAVDITGGRQ